MSAEESSQVVPIMAKRIDVLSNRLHDLIQFARGNDYVLGLIHETLDDDRQLSIAQARAAASGGGGER